MRGWGVAGRLFLAYAVFIVVLAVSVGTVSFVDSRDRGYAEAGDRLLAVATAIADSPLVVTAASSLQPTAALQAYSAEVSENAGLEFISVLSPAGVRWTHPDSDQIGRVYPGQTAPALAGEPLTEVTTGALGASVRAVVPIVDPDGQVVGLVATGERISAQQTALDAHLPAILALTVLMLLAGALGTRLLSRYLRRVTLGWGPEELARRFAVSDALLNSAGAGLILVDTQGTVLFCNETAARLLDLAPRAGARGHGFHPASIDELALPPDLAELLRSGRTVRNEVHSSATRELLVSQRPAFPAPERARNGTAALGTVATILDGADLPARRSRSRGQR
jgi:sensor histidine kinase regulating citrate/malate metabolism